MPRPRFSGAFLGARPDESPSSPVLYRAWAPSMAPGYSIEVPFGFPAAEFHLVSICGVYQDLVNSANRFTDFTQLLVKFASFLFYYFPPSSPPSVFERRGTQCLNIPSRLFCAVAGLPVCPISSLKDSEDSVSVWLDLGGITRVKLWLKRACPEEKWSK